MSASARPATRCRTTTSGAHVELRIRDGVITVVFLGEVIAEHLVVSPGETSINDDHYGGPRPMPRRPVRPKSSGREGLLCARPGGRGLHQGSGRSGDDRAGPRPGRASPRLEAIPRQSRWSSRPRTGGRLRPVPGGRRGVHPRLRLGRSPPDPTGRGPHRRAARRSRCVHCRTTPSAISHDRDPTAAGRRLGGRASPAAAVGHPEALARAAGHGQDPALEARGVPPHPDRGRDRLA